MSDTYHAGGDYQFTAVQPDLCCCKSTKDSAVAAPAPTDVCCCKVPTERDKSAAKLREMMQYASPHDKCELCKAAELLEKKDGGGNPLMAFPLLMLGMLWGGNGAVDPATLRAMANVMEKEAEKGGG